MAAPTIPNGKDYMNSVTYTGTGSDNAVTGVGFAPDLTMLKRRDSGSADWGWYDTSRGATKAGKSNKQDAESTESNGLKVFGTDGFTVGSSGDANASGGTFVSHNWSINGGTTVTNDASATGIGDIDSVYQVNTTSRVSVVTYTGTGSAGEIAHGLGVIPQIVIVKKRNSTGHWSVYLHTLGGTKISYTSVGVINSANSGYWNNADATSSVFSVGTQDDVNGSSNTYVAWCFGNVDGFSKVGSYTGNGSPNGSFIYTGHKPQSIMIIRTSSANDWNIWDSARFPVNPDANNVFWNLDQGDNGTSLDMDVLSNGFKLRTTNSQVNGSGNTYTYWSIASNPFVGDGTSPITAR
jgi:hypothetical protein